ncbi:hypothetical protein CLOM_g2666, partial [Closterium sp. NIES-68]
LLALTWFASLALVQPWFASLALVQPWFASLALARFAPSLAFCLPVLRTPMFALQAHTLRDLRCFACAKHPPFSTACLRRSVRTSLRSKRRES